MLSYCGAYIDIYADVCFPARATANARQFARVLGGSRPAAAAAESANTGNHVQEAMALSASVALPKAVALPIPGGSLGFRGAAHTLLPNILNAERCMMHKCLDAKSTYGLGVARLLAYCA